MVEAFLEEVNGVLLRWGWRVAGGGVEEGEGMLGKTWRFGEEARGCV